jgi:hypothetical protein
MKENEENVLKVEYIQGQEGLCEDLKESTYGEDMKTKDDHFKSI